MTTRRVGKCNNALIKEWCIAAYMWKRPTGEVLRNIVPVYICVQQLLVKEHAVFQCREHKIFCQEGAPHLSLNISRGQEDLWSCHPGDNECTHTRRKVKAL